MWKINETYFKKKLNRVEQKLQPRMTLTLLFKDTIETVHQHQHFCRTQNVLRCLKQYYPLYSALHIFDSPRTSHHQPATHSCLCHLIRQLISMKSNVSVTLSAHLCVCHTLVCLCLYLCLSFSVYNCVCVCVRVVAAFCVLPVCCFANTVQFSRPGSPEASDPANQLNPQ